MWWVLVPRSIEAKRQTMTIRAWRDSIGRSFATHEISLFSDIPVVVLIISAMSIPILIAVAIPLSFTVSLVVPFSAIFVFITISLLLFITVSVPGTISVSVLLGILVLFCFLN